LGPATISMPESPMNVMVPLRNAGQSPVTWGITGAALPPSTGMGAGAA
jgi:hypothetical protein